MIFRASRKIFLSLGITTLLLVIGINTFNFANGQVDIPEAKIINEDDTSENPGENATLLTYTDDSFGFSFDYPSSWTQNPDTTNAYNLVGFTSPDDTAIVYVYAFPRENDESLKEFGDRMIKNNEDFKISEYYRNSTTKLADQPAVRGSGTYFNTITIYQQSLGYESSNTKSLQIFTLDQSNDVFIGLVLHADNTASYKKHLPEVEAMIKSFKLISTGPIISEEDE